MKWGRWVPTYKFMSIMFRSWMTKMKKIKKGMIRYNVIKKLWKPNLSWCSNYLLTWCCIKGCTTLPFGRITLSWKLPERIVSWCPTTSRTWTLRLCTIQSISQRAVAWWISFDPGVIIYLHEMLFYSWKVGSCVDLITISHSQWIFRI